MSPQKSVPPMFPWGLVKKTHFNNACSTISSARKGRSTVTCPGQIIIFKKEKPPRWNRVCGAPLGCRGKQDASKKGIAWLHTLAPRTPLPCIVGGRVFPMVCKRKVLNPNDQCINQSITWAKGSSNTCIIAKDKEGFSRMHATSETNEKGWLLKASFTMKA